MKETVLKQAKQKHELNRDAFQIIYQNVMCHCHDALYENGSFGAQVERSLKGHEHSTPGNAVFRVFLPEEMQNVPSNDEELQTNLESIKRFFLRYRADHQFLNFQVFGDERSIYFRLQAVKLGAEHE